ncbi:MAG TPA: rhodanese-like domain-containing protein [Promineifilum sp.]|nr:rhodanese-like domain-containing protein [Promineifilum sp.]HRO90874.1 rhodanese-like domain-containing protein [Promineifilum sp.]
MRSSLILLFVLLLGASLALAACGGGGETTTPAADEIDINALAPSIDVQTAYAARSNPTVFMLDVREPDEYDAGHIPGITLIPMGEIPDRLSEIPTDVPVIVTCRTGNRSGQVVDFLREQGFTNVHNMDGGIVAWQKAGYEVEE